MHRKHLTFVMAATLLVAFGLWAQDPPPAPPGAPAETVDPQYATPPVPEAPVKFEGTVVNTKSPAIFQAGTFTLSIDEWTTPDQAAELKKTLAVAGQKALREKVWDMKQIGYLKVSGSMGKPIFVARAIPVAGGLIVRVLTTSYVAKGSGTLGDYPFAILEMAVPNEGRGRGKIVAMAQLGFNGAGEITVEAYGVMPVDLLDVGMKAPKKK